MKNTQLFKSGVFTVIVTPFKNDGEEINWIDLSNLIEKQINSNVAGIIILGTTSESPTVSNNEKKEIVNFVWNNYKNKIKIIVGIGGNDTRNVIEFGEYCTDKSDGLMVTVPNYNKPTQNGIYKHFYKIVNNSKISNKEIILYNIPSRCSVNMNPETIINLYNSCPNIVAIKEANGSLDQICKIRKGCDIKIFSGDDMNILPIISLGGVGVISVISNLIPNKISKIVELCLNNNFSEGSKLFYEIHDFINVLFISTNPIPLKHLLFKNDYISTNDVRLPLTNIEDNQILDKLNNFIHFNDY